MFQVEQHQGGELAWSDFGIGVKIGFIYTPDSIFRRGLELKPNKTIARPLPSDGLSQFAWCRWDRFGQRAANELVSRCRMRSLPDWSASDLHDYAGTKKPYSVSWQDYIPVSERMKTLRRVFKIGRLDGRRLLDLGCAGARHFFELAMLGVDPHGIECNPHFIAQSHPMLENRVFFGDALLDTYWFADGSFDIVICSAHGHVHFPELPRLTSEISRIISMHGILLFDAPQRPLHIGPNLSSDYRVYLRTLKQAGFKPMSWSNGQIVCVAQRRSSDYGSI